MSGEKTRGFLQLEPSGDLINGLWEAGHLAFTAGKRAIPNAQEAVCNVPPESLTVICVQVEQILKLIKLQPHDENAKTNLAFGSGRIKNRWRTISPGSSQIPNTSECQVSHGELTPAKTGTNALTHTPTHTREGFKRLLKYLSIAFRGNKQEMTAYFVVKCKQQVPVTGANYDRGTNASDLS